MSSNIIVSRHAGAVEWLRARGVTGDVITHVTDSRQLAGKQVFGILPLHLCAIADCVITIDLPDLPADQRGKDLTPAEMDAAGAKLTRYVVQSFDFVE